MILLFSYGYHPPDHKDGPDDRCISIKIMTDAQHVMGCYRGQICYRNKAPAANGMFRSELYPRPPSERGSASGDPPENYILVRRGRASPIVTTRVIRGRDPANRRSCVGSYAIIRQAAHYCPIPDIRAGTLPWREIEVENPARSDIPEDPGDASAKSPGKEIRRRKSYQVISKKDYPWKTLPVNVMKMNRLKNMYS